MKIKSIVALLVFASASCVVKADLYLKNDSNMTVEFKSSRKFSIVTSDSNLKFVNATSGTLPPKSREVYFQETPSDLMIKEKDKGVWFPLAGTLAGLSLNKTAYKLGTAGRMGHTGHITIHNSTKYNPLGWNLEAKVVGS